VTASNPNTFGYGQYGGCGSSCSVSANGIPGNNGAFGGTPTLTTTGEYPTCSTPGVFSGGAVTQVASGCVWPSNMSRRNAFRGPSTYNINLGVFKSFDITERVKMRLSAEVENLFNHHNMFITGNGTNDVFSSFLLPGVDERCSNTKCDATVADPNNTDPNFTPYIPAYKFGRRHMQLGVRFTF
jgi:hypothetical protein